ncbi:hypothetical protein EIN_181310 [Entamoeba invadens IP1]|uniref:hypothetical protein n=1 Tax=Entamoeba invadens IP1 TaxID=370355 RepID=UPI0002C3DBB3|nr:hypothetical protein EIN_181310 [Entamoeba invadens IP1]ELP93974.1 hypothetical protein EIN_181310 [Entamoeba invadens IP1]|eukprot:XP_004260745.1 hypothetical protein EIN_181310 [Entamoeba invadens IP1]
MSKQFVIVMLGSGAVGKSSLTVQLVNGIFMTAYNPTVENSFNTTINVDGQMIPLSIRDTAGQEEYTSLRDQYIRSGDGFIGVYSIISKTSFLEISNLDDLLYRVLEKDHNEKFPIVIVGNKCDLEEMREVSNEELKKLASEWDCPCYETSAKNKINVLESFQSVVREIRRRAPKTVQEEKVQKKKICTLL